MDEVYSLIQSLTSREWESLGNYLTCFSTHAHDEGGLKQLQLAKLLREANECPQQNRCSVLIYGAKDDDAFDKLKSRLKEKVLDFLLTDISNDKKQELDEADLAIIKMKKKSAQFQQLFYSKKRIALLHMLDDIIALAKEYEQYSILVDHLRHKKNMNSWKKGQEEYEKTNAEMEFYTSYGHLYNKAEHYYYELIIMDEYGSKKNNKKKLSFLKKVIPEIAEANSRIKSPHVNYSLKALELEFFQLNSDYLKARSICLEWLSVVRNNKSVYRRQRVGVVYDNLSRCEYYLNNYEQAIASAQEAQKHFNAGSENYCIALEQEFYALFAMGNYTDAGSIAVANRMLTSASRKELGEFRWAKYNYLLACVLFKLGRFSETLNLLSQNLELSKDKTGWEIGVRTLKIMTLIELGKYAEAELAVLALREFIKYTDKKAKERQGAGDKGQAETAGVSKRDRMIFNLLMQACRAGFMFTTLNGKSHENISILAAKPETSNLQHETVRWEPFTHEVIPFHEWFAQKCGKKIAGKYSHKKLSKAGHPKGQSAYGGKKRNLPAGKAGKALVKK